MRACACLWSVSIAEECRRPVFIETLDYTLRRSHRSSSLPFALDSLYSVCFFSFPVTLCSPLVPFISICQSQSSNIYSAEAGSVLRRTHWDRKHTRRRKTGGSLTNFCRRCRHQFAISAVTHYCTHTHSSCCNCAGFLSRSICVLMRFNMRHKSCMIENCITWPPGQFFEGLSFSVLSIFILSDACLNFLTPLNVCSCMSGSQHTSCRLNTVHVLSHLRNEI